MILKKLAGALITVGLGVAAFGVYTQVSGDKVKIGYITDPSRLHADIDRQDGAETVKMAIEGADGRVLGKPIELVTVDHQNKADIATPKVCEWMDQQGLDMLLGSTNSATGLTMDKVASKKKYVFINIGAGTTRLTNGGYTPYTIHYAYGTVALAKGTGSAMVKQDGKSQFFLIANYAFSHPLKNDTMAVVKTNDGTAAGSVEHPLSASDFSSYLLRAQSSKAQTLDLVNAGDDTINSIKAAREFDITKTMRTASLLMFINDMHGLGLQTTEGLLMTDSWYWDMNDASRKFTNRYFMKMKRMPNSLRTADYSAVSNYTKVVAAAGTDDPDKIIAQLGRTKTDGFYTKGYIRRDDRAIHGMYLLQVKIPAKSKKSQDYLKAVATIPGGQAFTTPAKSKRSLIKR